MPDTVVDVAIIGGGPAGSTCASLLLKYNPRLKVAIVERERFPRDHVGESQLPAIGRVLDEMECWNKVEAANFPIKIGATYRWGRTDELWDFEFIPDHPFKGGPRPGRYEGERRQTAFQVDRARYDEILLDHAREMGCAVLQPRAVREVRREGDRVEGLVLEDGEVIRARHYVDASGHSGILRRAMGVEIECPTSLQNIALWRYWQNAEWAVSVGVGGTRVQVLSLGYGWIWFIPLGPTRTSVGLIVPASYYRESGKRPEELYEEAMAHDPVVSRLLRNAVPEEEPLRTTKDWSFVSSRLAGENWWLAGESAGFADPILAAGMTLAHLGARDLAYVILAEERGEYDGAWLRSWYDETHRAKIRQHVQFADFWYSANGCFSDLQEHTRAIARDAGFDMTPQEAWRWLGTGGFVDGDTGGTDFGGYSIGAVKVLGSLFTGTTADFAVLGKNVFRLDLEGAEKGWGARLEGGRIFRHRTYHRGGKSLPTLDLFGQILRLAKGGTDLNRIADDIYRMAAAERWSPAQTQERFLNTIYALEAMICDGWIVASYDPALPVVEVAPEMVGLVHPNRDVALVTG